MDPVINIEENIGKTVGRRRQAAPMHTTATQIAESKEWRAALGNVGIPKGVYRFKSHEEADAWWIEQATRSRNREGK